MTITSNSRVDSIQNFHIEKMGNNQAQIFHDTESDEDEEKV